MTPLIHDLSKFLFRKHQNIKAKTASNKKYIKYRKNHKCRKIHTEKNLFLFFFTPIKKKN